MRILVVNADYPRFLAWLYRRQPGLEHAGYAAQMAARNASLFGVADFYSRNFTALGRPGPLFKPILRPFARRLGLSPSLDAQAENILLAQIEDFKPDLVLNQD